MPNPGAVERFVERIWNETADGSSLAQAGDIKSLTTMITYMAPEDNIRLILSTGSTGKTG